MFQFIFRSQNHVWHSFNVHVGKYVFNAAILRGRCWRSSGIYILYSYSQFIFNILVLFLKYLDYIFYLLNFPGNV